MKLRTHYTLIILALVLGMALMFTEVMRQTFHRSMYQVAQAQANIVTPLLLHQLEGRAKTLVDILDENLVNPIYQLDLWAVREILRSLQREPNILEVQVFDETGRLFCGGKPDRILCANSQVDATWVQALGENREPVVWRHPQGVQVLMPLYLGKNLQGGLRLLLTDQYIRQVIQQAQGQIHQIAEMELERQYLSVGALVLFLVAIGVVLAMLAARYLVFPINELIRMTKTLQSGDMDSTIHLNRQDELGMLADTMDHMRCSIVSSYEEIMAHRELTLHAENKKAIAEATAHAKGIFLANMSHEIRTPMNGVMGMIDLALKTELSSKTRDYLEQAKKSSRSLLRVINDILDFSKIEEGKLTLELLDFHLGDLLNDAIGLFKQHSLDKEIELVVAAPPNALGVLVGDQLRLQQILINLTGNAIKFTPRGEIVLAAEPVELTDHNARIHFSVRDTGIGLTEEQQARLFSPFSQADDSITRKFGGTGLGLAICKRLVELMGGEIWVESRPGQGSTFHFTVPLGRKPEPGVHLPLALPEELQSLRALVVDDNDTVRTVYTENLRYFGMAVSAVASGEESLAALRAAAANQTPYHLILMDWRMPGLDGVETARIIRQDPALTQVLDSQTPPLIIPKIILCTAFGQAQTEEDARKLNLDAYLIKPLTSSHLLNTILEVFGKQLPQTAGTGLPDEVDHALAGNRVLLVEDNDINRQVALEILQSVGLVVEMAGDGREAVELVSAKSFDLVLMDIQMPAMDGYTATRLIRGNSSLQHLPIIAMTAHARLEDREQSLQAGMNDHVTKPIDQQQLFATLRRWLSPKESEHLPPVTASPLTAAKPVSLPATLPGLDLPAALARLNQNQDLLLSILLAFQRDYADAADRLRSCLQGRRKDDAENAARQAHALKGVAGNLSAMGLFEAARILEKAIRDHQQAAWPALLAELEKNLHEVIRGIETMPVREEPVPLPVACNQDQAAAGPLFKKLAVLLADKDVEAQEVFDHLKPLIHDTRTDAHLARLASCLDCFDFKQAQEALEALAGELHMDEDNC